VASSFLIRKKPYVKRYFSIFVDAVAHGNDKNLLKLGSHGLRFLEK
jgi:hypothetical protein